MHIVYNIILGVSIAIAVFFSLLVLLTGKADAMSGGSGIRTSFRGKAGFEDILSRLILGLGSSFMALMLLLDWLGSRLPK